MKKKKKPKMNPVLTLRKAWVSLVRTRIKAETELLQVLAEIGEPELDEDGFDNLPRLDDNVAVQQAVTYFRTVFLASPDSQAATDLINRLNRSHWAPVPYRGTGRLVQR